MSVSNKLRCNPAWNKNPALSVLSILSRGRVKDFSKKYSSLLEANQNFQNFRQSLGFSGATELCLNLFMEFDIISLMKLQQNQLIKYKFIIAS